MVLPVVALDVGGATLKATRVFAGDGPHTQSKHAKASSGLVVALANQIATVGAANGAVLMGKELLAKERQRAKLHYVRPVERGYCVNWNIESDLWSHLFSSKMLHINPHEHALVATAPLFAPAVLSETMDQVVFEEFGFAAHTRVNAAEMCVLSYAEHSRQEALGQVDRAEPSPKRKRQTASTHAAAGALAQRENEEEDQWNAFHSSSCQLVIDSGFSFTHIVPVIDGKVFHAAVKRINVGGKLLTNYLKEIVSFRQWNVMDESTVINELKEALCYCSLELEGEMTRLHKDRSARKHWILPDFVRSFQGRLRADPAGSRVGGDDDEQALEMGVEMVTVPEVLFHPSDIGIDQAGLAEAVMQCVNACPVDVQSTLLENILLVGGNTKFRNFRERLVRDMRPLVPDEFGIRILSPSDPISTAIDGCSLFASTDNTSSRSVSKQEYEEHGSNICFKRFR